MSPSHFRELEVWQIAMSMAKLIYGVTSNFPREERFGLTSQLRRSAVSIPSNIAEGNARSGTRDYARFVSISQGSRDLAFGDAELVDDCLAVCDRVGKMLLSLHQSLFRKLETESRVPSPGVNNA